MKKKIRRIPIAVPIASMGDIAFLLIIFFVICSHFAKDVVKVDPASSIDAKKLDNYPMVVAINKEGKIYFQGEEIPAADTLTALVQKEVEGRTNPDLRTVVLRCDKAVKKDIFESVIEAIAEGGGRIAAVGDEKKK